jgi:predicted amidophosphoribosyltransferase
MDEVKFCSSCGKLTSSCYTYCPWCGKSLESKTDLSQVLSRSMDKLEKVQLADRLHELEKLETCLDNLEEELEAFLSKASH